MYAEYVTSDQISSVIKSCIDTQTKKQKNSRKYVFTQ